MADQKNDDTKTPFARRGARPFGGPADTSVPSRPFMRPATAQRPTAAPFVAPVGPGKLVLRNAAPAPAAKLPTPVAPRSIPSADIDTTPHPAPPPTNEIVALDAIDAFDAAWGASQPLGGPVEAGPIASRLDELSLGSASGGREPWAGEITATDVPAGETEAATVPVTFESSDAAAVSTTPAWLEDDMAPPVRTPAPAASEIAPVADDVPLPPAAVQPVSEVDGGYGFGEWTDAHTIPASDEIMGVLPDPPVTPVVESLGDGPPAPVDWTADIVPDVAEPPPRFEFVEATQEPQPEVNPEIARPVVVIAVPSETYSPHAARIAATFDRLADRVRSGEIDVSSIAPEATDAAVLASVLAVLLGGSRSR